MISWELFQLLLVRPLAGDEVAQLVQEAHLQHAVGFERHPLLGPVGGALQAADDGGGGHRGPLRGEERELEFHAVLALVKGGLVVGDHHGDLFQLGVGVRAADGLVVARPDQAGGPVLFHHLVTEFLGDEQHLLQGHGQIQVEFQRLRHLDLGGRGAQEGHASQNDHDQAGTAADAHVRLEAEGSGGFII